MVRRHWCSSAFSLRSGCDGDDTVLPRARLRGERPPEADVRGRKPYRHRVVDIAIAMNVAATPALSPADIVLAYHARTKHSLKRYAAGPETLDWDTQPNPFREFAGCARTELEPGADRLATSFAEACTPGSVGPPARAFLRALRLEGVWAGPLGATLQSVERQSSSDRSLYSRLQRARHRRR